MPINPAKFKEYTVADLLSEGEAKGKTTEELDKVLLSNFGKTSSELEGGTKLKDLYDQFQVRKTASNEYYAGEAEKAMRKTEAGRATLDAAVRKQARGKLAALGEKTLGVYNPFPLKGEVPEEPTTYTTPDTSKRLSGILKGAAGAIEGPEKVSQPVTTMQPAARKLPKQEWYESIAASVPSSEGTLKLAELPATAKRGYIEEQAAVEKELANKSFSSRLVDDAKGLATAVPKMVGILTEPLPKGTDEEAYGAEVGKGLTEGIVGGTLYTANNLPKAASARPLSTGAQYLPLGSALKIGAKASPRVAAALEKVSGTAGSVARKLVPAAVHDAVGAYKRAFSDTRAQGDPLATGLTEEASLEGAGTYAVHSGEVPTPEVKGTAPAYSITRDIVTPTPKSTQDSVASALQAVTGVVNKQNVLHDAEKARRVAQEAFTTASDAYEAALKQSRDSLLAGSEAVDQASLDRLHNSLNSARDRLGKATTKIPADMRVSLASTSLEELDKASYPATPAAPMANVFTIEQATQMAKEMTSKLGAEDPATTKALAERLLRHYAENPEAPVPTATTAGKPIVTGVPVESPQRVVRNEDLLKSELHKGGLREMASNVTPAPVKDMLADVNASKAWAPNLVDNIIAAGDRRIAAADALVEAAAKQGMPALLDLPADVAKSLAVDVLVSKKGTVAVRKALALHLENMVHEGGILKSSQFVQSLENTIEKAGVGKELASYIKQSLTVHNPASGVNNFVANLAFDMARSGNPVSVVKDLSETVIRLSTKSSQDAALLKQWVKLGLLDSTAIGQDVAAMAAKPSTLVSIARLGPVGRVLEKAYAWGDNIYKAKDAFKAHDIYSGLASMLNDGEYLDLAMSPNVKARIVGGSAVVELLADNKVIKKITREEALLRAAARQAQDKFMDYRELPGVAKYFRNAGALSVVSPFTTWFLKAIDLPGKRGLLTRSILDTDNAILGTNSAAVSLDAMGGKIKSAASRAAYINGMREVLRNETDPALQEAVAFAPTQAKLAIVRELADPSYISVMGMGNWGYLGPTDLLARVGIQTAGIAADYFKSQLPAEVAKELRVQQLAGPEGKTNYLSSVKSLQDDIAKAPSEDLRNIYKQNLATLNAEFDMARSLTKEQREEYTRSREFTTRLQTKGYATTADALSLVQLSGTSLKDVIDTFEEAGEMGKTLPVSKLVFNTLVPMALGGIGKSLVKLGAQAAKQAGVGSTGLEQAALRSDDDPELDEDDYLRFAIRTMTGVGWRKMASEKVTGDGVYTFFGKAGKEWKSSMGVDATTVKALERDLAYHERHNNVARAAEITKQLARAEFVSGVIDEEMDLYQQNLVEALSKVSAGKLPKLLGK